MSPTASADPAAVRGVVLLGLPGAGKSTVAPLVAAALGWRCVDLDRAIESAAGMSVAEIFAGQGEAFFRAWERRLTAEVLTASRGPLVLAPGAGWIEDPSHQRLVGQGLIGVHLQVDPVVAAARLRGSSEPRPLVGGSDMVGRITALRSRRESLYLQSSHTVSVDSMTPDEVAAIIVSLASG
ncbi:MAG: shikimate kinase [Gemmatimonadetes bacterium]|nr:shikimate kinase [Gemmatimonadota bacterium]